MTKLLTIKETALALRLSTGTVYGMVARREIRHVRVGGRKKILVPEDAVGEYLQGREVAPSSGASGAAKTRKESAAPRPQPGKFKHLGL